MAELSQHNVTSVKLQPTAELTTDGGAVFYTRNVVIEHDDGEDITVKLFSDNAHALCVPIDPEAATLDVLLNARVNEVEHTLHLAYQSIEALKDRNTELVDKLMARSERNDGLRKDRDYWKSKYEDMAGEIIE